MNNKIYNSSESNKATQVNMKSAQHCIKIAQHLLDQSVDESFCDIVLQVEDQDFRAHKCVLASCSEYFYKMFTLEMKEKYDKTITIKGINAHTFRAILDWIYTGKIELNEDNLDETLQAVSMLQLTDLFDEINTFVKSILNHETVFTLFSLTSIYSVQKLLTSVVTYFCNYFQELSTQVKFEVITKDIVYQVLTSNQLCISNEKSAFDFLVKWVNFDIEERREDFPDLFKLIRLQFVPIEYVINVVRKIDLVRQFHDCRDLVEDALAHHILPDLIEKQTPRSSAYVDLIMFCPPVDHYLWTLDIESKQLNKYPTKVVSSVNKYGNCAIAIKPNLAVFCGAGDSFSSSADVVKCDGFEWKKMPSMTSPRAGAGATFFNNDLYVFGGENKNFLGTFEKYREEWKSFKNPCMPRSYLAAQTMDDKIYLIGGYMPAGTVENDQSSSNYKRPCKTTTIFRPAEMSWEDVGDMNRARASFACAAYNSKIYVLGGADCDMSAEFLDTKSNLWTNIQITSSSKTIYRIYCYCIIKGKLYFSDAGQVFVYDIDKQHLDVLANSNYKSTALIPLNRMVLNDIEKKVTMLNSS